MPTCSPLAKKSHVPTEAFRRIYFSCSVNLKISWSISIDAGDCLRRSWMDELVTMAFPYDDPIKSSTSCVIVVTQSPYLRARFTSPKRNLALSSYCMIFQASSTTRSRLRSLDRARFHTYPRRIYMAMGRRISSRSRTENTTNPHSIFTLVRSENTQAKTPLTYLSSLSTRPLAPSIVSRTE